MRTYPFHPILSLFFFACAASFTLAFRHPVWVLLSFGCAAAYLTALKGQRGFAFSLLMLPCILLFTFWYASFHHFGLTVLGENGIGNVWTLESLLYGLVLGTTIAALILWAGCLHAVFTTDHVTYLLGRISPHLALFFSLLLRLIPRLKIQARKVHTARSSIGRGIHQGPILQRIRNRLSIFSILVTWLIENLLVLSESMKCRGVTLRGRKSFALFRFENRDRMLAAIFSLLFMVILSAKITGQTSCYYDPLLVMQKISPVSVVDYLCYVLFCLLPMFVQLYETFRTSKALRSLD